MGAIALGAGACNKNGQNSLGPVQQQQQSSSSAPTTSSDTSSSTSSSSDTSSSDTSSSDTSSPDTSSSSTDAVTAPSEPGTPAAAVDQSSPDAVLRSFFVAMGDADGKRICSLMAYQGLAFDSLPASAMSECGAMMSSQVSSIGPQIKPYLGLIKISGAQIQGDKASYANVNVEPKAAEAQLRQSFKDISAIKIKGKWYINVTKN